MLVEGLSLMIIGMSTVMGFLCLLVALMHLSGLFFRWYNQAFPEAAVSKTQAEPKSAKNHRELAIALAAIAAHRSARQGD